MPRRDVVLYASFRGNKRVTRAFSNDRAVEVRWAKVRVGMSLSVSPAVAPDHWGEAVATVRFDREVCDADVDLVGVDGWTWTDGCRRSATFDLSEMNFEDEPVVLTFHAELSRDGFGLEDDLTGTSNTVSLTVPGRDF